MALDLDEHEHACLTPTAMLLLRQVLDRSVRDGRCVYEDNEARSTHSEFDQAPAPACATAKEAGAGIERARRAG
jgi:hypothetical protein